MSGSSGAAVVRHAGTAAASQTAQAVTVAPKNGGAEFAVCCNHVVMRVVWCVRAGWIDAGGANCYYVLGWNEWGGKNRENVRRGHIRTLPVEKLSSRGNPVIQAADASQPTPTER